MSYENKVVIITGGSSGIGAATALRLVKQKAIVVIIGRNLEKLLNVQEKCKEFGTEPFIITADLNDDASAKTIVDKTIEKFGKIDVLINNAGEGGKGRFTDENALETYDKVERIYLRQVIRLTHIALPYLTATKGNIVMVSSVNAMQTLPASWAYCAIKAGLDHLTRQLAVELSSKGIRVNSVNPGPVKTDILKNQGISEDLQEKYYENVSKATLLKRVSDADEIADIIEFLGCDRARGVTGSAFLSDNGMLHGPTFKDIL